MRGIRSAATGAVAGFGGLLVGAGRALVQGLARGITSAIGAAAAAARRAAAAVKGFFPGSPVREGPLRSWNNGGAGIRLLGMLTEGIEAARPSLVAQMDDIASIVKGTDLALNGAVSLRTVSTQTGSAQTAAAVAAMASQRPTVAPPATPPMPSTLVLRVGDREFTGYLEEIADGVNVAVVDSLYAGRKG